MRNTCPSEVMWRTNSIKIPFQPRDYFACVTWHFINCSFLLCVSIGKMFLKRIIKAAFVDSRTICDILLFLLSILLDCSEENDTPEALGHCAERKTLHVCRTPVIMIWLHTHTHTHLIPMTQAISSFSLLAQVSRCRFWMFVLEQISWRW